MAQFIDFGNGKEGNLTISAGNLGGVGGFGVATFTGTAGNNYGTFSDVGYFNGGSGGRIGDLCIIHQSQNSGAGNWEIVRITNRVGSTVYFDRNLVNTYVSGAQIQSAPNLYNGTISGSLIQYNNWGGSSGGIVFIVDRGTLNITGSVRVNGVQGSTYVSSGARAGGATGGGFRGGNGYNPSGVSNAQANQGEGTAGTGGLSTAANGNGGGGAFAQGDWGAGAGGGNGAAGSNGNSHNGTLSYGGASTGTTNLSTMVFGGGGGGSVKGYSYSISGGGSGGGIVVIFANRLTVSGGISVNGGQGGGDMSVAIGAGGGAGGSILIKCNTASLGSGLITASAGGAGVGSQSYGGAGAVGRIAVYHFGTVTGTTSPTFNDTQDSSLNNQIYGIIF